MVWEHSAVWLCGIPLAVAAVLVLYRRIGIIYQRVSPAVPGLRPSSKKGGNFDDIARAGSLHEFLVGLHKQFGPIASFWWGTQHTVSIASPELFKQHQDLFDRPVELFSMFEPFITKHSIQFANGSDGRARREAFDKVFSYDKLEIYYHSLQLVADEITAKWTSATPEEHLPLGEHMFLFALKTVLITLMGDKFKDDKEALTFKHNYDLAWEEMEMQLTDPINDSRQKLFDEEYKFDLDDRKTKEMIIGFRRKATTYADVYIDGEKAVIRLREVVRHAVEERESSGAMDRDFLLIDAIIGHHSDEEKRLADAVSYTVGGFHTTANLLTWCVYYMCLHPDVQDKVYKEIVDVLGPDGKLSHQTLGKLRYLRQVLDETLRRAVVAPWAARVSDRDICLAGYSVPAKVPVIHALGVSMMDDKVWQAPDRFDPDRFSPEGSKGRPTIAFSPYGFAGRRQCPGYRFAYVEASVLLVSALQKVQFLLEPGQDVRMKHGLVTHPQQEIWVKVVHRN